MTLSLTDKKEIRKFGAIALVFFGFLCVVAVWRHKVLITYFFGTLSLLGLGFLIIPKTLQPVYNKWMQFAHFIGKMITAIILTLAYYLVITPFGLVKRLFGGPLMPLEPDKSASSYWISRTESVQPKERFIKRF